MYLWSACSKGRISSSILYRSRTAIKPGRNWRSGRAKSIFLFRRINGKAARYSVRQDPDGLQWNQVTRLCAAFVSSGESGAWIFRADVRGERASHFGGCVFGAEEAELDSES